MKMIRCECSILGGGGWVCGTSLNFWYPRSACGKKWTQTDLRLCENEASKRFAINEKGGQLDKKLREI